MIRIGILASGTGSNAIRIMAHFADHPRARVTLLVTNNAACGAIPEAEMRGIAVHLITRHQLAEQETVQQLRQHCDVLVLAGFLLLVPENLVQAFPYRILNLHPALLPKFGGKGMYGMHVHRAVKAAGEKETGITIHVVNEKFDDGPVIARFSTPVMPADSPADIAQRVQQLEHAHFAAVVESYIAGINA
jgi:phosphoribosylglycinamide formyltransferase-1